MTWRSPTVVAALFAFALAVAFGGWITLRLRRWFERRRSLATSRRGQRGEERARDWLVKNGFRILGEQEPLFCRMEIDGETTEYEVCVDFVVEKRGQRGIVEVKTGGAANPAAPGTRRQVFEYATLYGAERVYMFDGDSSQLHEIAFENLPRAAVLRNRWREWLMFACGAVTAALAWAIWMLANRI